MPDDARVSNHEQTTDPETPEHAPPDPWSEPPVGDFPPRYAPSGAGYPPPAADPQGYPPPAAQPGYPPSAPPGYPPSAPPYYPPPAPPSYPPPPHPGYQPPGAAGYPPSAAPGYPVAPPGYSPDAYQQAPPGTPPGQQWAPGYPPPGYPYPTRRPGPVDPLGRPMAEWWRRVLAYVIDGLVLAIPWTIILSVTGSTDTSGSTSFSTASFTSSTWVGLGIGFIVVLGYFAFLDGNARGQTLGKLVLGIAVRDIRTGGPIGAGRALGRRFFFFATYFVFIVPFIFTALSPLWDARRQAWHDKVVGSCVARVH